VKAGVIKEGERVRFGFHNFRNALATALVKLKVEAKTVQGILRHEDFGTTMQLLRTVGHGGDGGGAGQVPGAAIGRQDSPAHGDGSMRNHGSDLRILGWIVGWEFSSKAAKCFRMMVARDGVEPPTPAFSGLASPVGTSLDQKHLSRTLPPKLPN
jgi:hypothetical protein